MRTCSTFEWAASGQLLVRRESLGLELGLDLLYVSDLHLRAGLPARLEAQVLEAAVQTRPDHILLGGDLVDSASGLERLADLVARLARLAPVGAVSGNHDRMVGRERVQEAVCGAGARWLEDGGDGLISGRPEEGATVLCAHDPAVVESVPETTRLVLAGHLHGGQMVLAERAGKLYPGALFYRWNGLRFERGSTTLLVSRGVTDTVPLRYNCPREVLLVKL